MEAVERLWRLGHHSQALSDEIFGSGQVAVKAARAVTAASKVMHANELMQKLAGRSFLLIFENLREKFEQLQKSPHEDAADAMRCDATRG